MVRDDDFLGDGYETPEEAALVCYPAGEARVLSVVANGDEATVRAEVNPSTGYAVYEFCERNRGRWFNVGHAG